MIRNWTEAIGPAGGGDPVDPDTAPPAMIQVWTMPGLHGVRTDDDPLGQMVQVLDEAGYTSVVATNCDQTYHRYLKLGEQLSVRARLLDVTGPKRTALGEGWFVTTRSTWFSSGEPVAAMDFRILKFRPPRSATPASPPARTTSPPAPARQPHQPPPAPKPASPMRPLVTPDTAFFWAGTAAGELRIQRCGSCGALRHPPGPMCPACGEASDGGYVVAAGTGEVYSYVVHHHPPVPGKRLPMVVALVQLPEGVRMVGEMPGVRPDQVRIGLPVRATFVAGGRGPDAARLAVLARGGDPPDLPARASPGEAQKDAPGPGDRRDAHLRDRLGAGDPRLPGRAPRPGPRRRAGGEGHLRQHLDHDRAGPALRLGLGRNRTRWSGRSPSGWACPATRARRSPSAGRSPRSTVLPRATSGWSP